MSAGSMTAIRTPANGARTTSPARSWSTHSSAFVMNPLGRRMVQVTPPPRTAASESRMYRVIASSRSPSSAELPDSRTTRRTPASRIRSITPGMSEKPGRRNAAAAPASAGDRLSGRSRSPATASTPGGSFARAASRTRPRTVAPLAASARTSSPPTVPVAPAHHDRAVCRLAVHARSVQRTIALGVICIVLASSGRGGRRRRRLLNSRPGHGEGPGNRRGPRVLAPRERGAT
jgi:hypothetical protein